MNKVYCSVDREIYIRHEPKKFGKMFSIFYDREKGSKKVNDTRYFIISNDKMYTFCSFDKRKANRLIKKVLKTSKVDKIQLIENVGGWDYIENKYCEVKMKVVELKDIYY